MLSLSLALNKYAFHWSFPELLADQEGMFRATGLLVNWTDITPKSVVSKSKMYTDALSAGVADLYHAGEWACISRVLSTIGATIVAKSVPGPGTLNRSFALYVREDSDIQSASDLSGRTVAIEEGTGAEYTTFADLERHMSRDEIKLVQVGEPHKRLVALLDDKVEAASLVGPWSDIGRALGLRMVMQTERSNPTTVVVREGTKVGTMHRFFSATNRAIDRVNEPTREVKELYLTHVGSILGEMKLSIPADELKDSVMVPRWMKWEPYTEQDFAKTYQWMVERGLARPGHGPSEAVGRENQALFR